MLETHSGRKLCIWHAIDINVKYIFLMPSFSYDAQPTRKETGTNKSTNSGFIDYFCG